MEFLKYTYGRNKIVGSMKPHLYWRVFIFFSLSSLLCWDLCWALTRSVLSPSPPLQFQQASGCCGQSITTQDFPRGKRRGKMEKQIKGSPLSHIRREGGRERLPFLPFFPKQNYGFGVRCAYSSNQEGERKNPPRRNWKSYYAWAAAGSVQ